MPMTPTVSIIIPTFNRLSFLKSAMASVFNQTYQHFELIVVDDGSTDGTTGFMTDYPGVRYVYQRNKGVSAARNRGIKLAKGALICFLDSDDTWHKKKLEQQVNAFESDPSLTVCYTNETWIKDGLFFNQHKHHQKYSGWIFEKALPLCIISPSSVMIKKEVFSEIGGFDEALEVCEDYDLWLRLTARHPVLFLDEALTIKQGGHQDQLSRKHWGMDRFRIIALEKILKSGIGFSQQKAVLDTIKKKAAVIRNGAWKRENYELWWRYFVREKTASFRHRILQYAQRSA